MQQATIEQMITKKQNRLIIVGKECIVDGRKGIKCDLKGKWISPSNEHEVSVQPFTLDTEHKLSSSEIGNLVELLKNNPKEYISELINLNFRNDLINLEATGTSHLLPTRFEKFYKSCVHFAGDKYEVYFVDDATKYLSDKISELRLRRVEDSRTYAIKTIETGKVQNLKFRFFDSFSWNKEAYCLYDDNNGYYCTETGPARALYYKIGLDGLDDEKKTDPADIKNMIDILDKFVLVHGPITSISSTSKQLIASSYDYIDGIIKIDGLDNAPRELVKKIYSLKQSDQ